MKELVDPQALEKMFQKECKTRLNRFTTTLSHTAQDPDDESHWNALHQELDSIANAARSVNDQETERVSRKLATLARQARQRQPLRMKVLEILLRGVTAIHCHCLEPQRSATGEVLDYVRLEKRLIEFTYDTQDEQ
ncbi:hypothetical protein [Magnetococcus marinus]|nr:hypothetical protein [Magnetococcus marinus]